MLRVSVRDGAREESLSTKRDLTVVALARKLRRRRPKGGQLSLREVSRELAASGYVNELAGPTPQNLLRA